MNAPALRAADPLSDRLARLRARQREPGWAQELLDLGREITLAAAGAVLTRSPEGWEAIAPATGDVPPDAWVALAEAAAAGRGTAAGAVGHEGRWVFAVLAGPATGPGTAARPAVLVLEVGSALPMDLVLTRERMAFLGALAEAGSLEAALHARTPQALAAAAAAALAGAADRREGLHEAAATLAAGLPGAERVAVLLPHRRQLGLSDQRLVEPGADLPRRLLAVADEAMERAVPRLLPQDASPSPAERAMTDAFGAHPILSVPSRDGRAVVIVAFAPGAVVSEALGTRLVPAATLLASVAEARRGRGMSGRRWVIMGSVAAGLGLLAVLPRDALVEAPVVLRPEHAQVVTAPFDGVLESSTVQPGDAVVARQTRLARIVTREVELELAAARARAANDLRDAAVARAGGQPAQEQISLLSARRADAQVALLEYRLDQADIRAPEDGVIIAGDLRRSIGQPLSRGQVLFEVALRGPIRAEALVLDEDIPRIREGQRLRFATAAEPGRPREAVVERIRPMAEVVEGRNVFRVIARIEDGSAGDLRPGMEGWAHIVTGRTTWLMSLVRDPVRWLRRRFWI